MVSSKAQVDYEELVAVPRMALRLPLRLPKPPGFDPGDLQTWPRVEGSAEYVDGELIYMPPSGDLQHDTCADVVGVLMEWRRRQPGFRVGTNEAGMMLGGDVRAGELSLAPGDRIPADPNLPGLEPQLADLFSQIDE